MQKYSDLDLIGFDINDMAIVEVRISKSRWDGEELISRDYHRASITPSMDTVEYLSRVSDDLVSQGFPALSDENVQQIIAVVDARRTPERVERYNAVIAAQQERFQVSE